ncbi:butyrophilin subfamily 1 member A1-like isoform X1 [Lepisosteus oculatus]|uniref:butyrophilin subfamily 1 member A1-like isoform X1 n=1 Tax=Lepisosteus oculatus TaxID=7918 RepID=UPI003714A9AD
MCGDHHPEMESDQSQWLFVTLLFLHQSCVSGSEWFQVVGPAVPVFVFPGEDTVLPCYLSPGISAEDLQIGWFRNDYTAPVCLYQNHGYIFEDQIPSYRGRAELFPEELFKGNVSLRLRDVRRSDHGLYNCLVRSPQHFEIALIDLSVRALGSQPSVSLHSPGGDQAQLLCRSEGWFPQPAVIWTDRDGNEVTSQPPTVDTDSQGLLSVSSYISVKQESNIFSCLVRSALPETDWGSQLHIPRDYFPAPSGWMVALFLTAAVTVAASVLLVIQWRRMDKQEALWKSELYYIMAVYGIPVVRAEIDAVKRAPIPKSQWQWLCSAAGEGSPIPDLQWQWLCSAAAAVNLDPDTAHCGLSLSEDGKRVRRGQRKSLSDNPHRFDLCHCVVSREAFTSGRHYWEVEVNDDWRIGVTRESARKKGEFRFVPQEGYWLLKYWWLNSYLCEFSALTDPETPLPLSLRPRKLGVCVDIEERKVSFYTVESRAHVYTFTNMVFPQGEKIYPVFWTEDRNKALELLPAVSVEIKPVTDS